MEMEELRQQSPCNAELGGQGVCSDGFLSEFGERRGEIVEAAGMETEPGKL